MGGNRMLPNLSMVIGGAASGKSAFAEQLVESSGLAKIYLATAQAHDNEMTAKIIRHQNSRDNGWHTVEATLDLSPALGNVTADDIVLLDCATLWLTNHLLAETDLSLTEEVLIAALATCKAPVVVVTNEVGAGIVPENALARRFRDAQGRLNQRLAAQAGLVVTVIAGLPMVLKGTLPE